MKEKVDMLSVQETKLKFVDLRLCSSLQGDSECDWKMSPAADNNAGGLLCVCNKGAFNLHNCFIDCHFIVLCGVWTERNHSCVMANENAPCDLETKREVWRKLLVWKQFLPAASWCKGGDFNAVWSSAERRGDSISPSYGRREMEDYNQFIFHMELVDIPIIGKRFTWFRPNGNSMSRLDRYLCSHHWLARWPDGSQYVLERELSDHCPSC